MQIQITNLDFNLIEADLQRLFTPYGEIHTVQIVRDHWNHRSKGRAYVDMPVDKEARQAILSLNGALLGRKNIIVSGVSFDEEFLNRSIIS
jgi:RNA recognition motif-containing protein